MKLMLTLAGVVTLAFMPAANAAVSDAEFKQMKQMLEEALVRIDELERREIFVDTVQQAEIEIEAEAIVATSEQVAVNTTAITELSWAERISVQGDFRYRYETDETDGLLLPEMDRSRNRQRIRGRAAIMAGIDDGLEVGLGIATGTDDPVSSNQTLGGGGSSKDIKLDLAYFDWQFADDAHLHAGKFKNQFTSIGGAALLYDSDWRPEGFNVSYMGEQFYVTALGTWLAADNSSGSGNSFNYGIQAGATPEIGGVRLDVGAGYHMIKANGRECYNAPGFADDCFGNTKVNAAGDVDEFGRFYAMDYSPLQLFAKASFDASIPFSVFFDYIVNADAKEIPTGPSAGQKLDSAYVVGGSIGKAKQRGEWQVKGYYQEKEADSLLGLLTDSDFAGGGTDSKGFVLKGRYMLRDSIYFQAAYLLGERQDSNGYENGSRLTSNPYDVEILQLDVQFKYK
jgi:hypothetical protein